MKRLHALLAAVATFIGAPGLLIAQDFGNRTTEMKEVAAIELPRPDIVEADIVDNPNPPNGGIVVPKPIYLVYRYYSCTPWYPFYIRDVFSSVVPRNQYAVEIDTAGVTTLGQNAEAQIVTDINHPAYGLYCLTVRVAVPWHAWQQGLWHRWYIRWAYNAPYWCWQDHWWNYRRRPSVTFSLSGNQEVPVNASPATGTATVSLNPDNTINYSVSFTGLTSPATASHFHSPAAPGANAGITLGLNLGTAQNQLNGTYSGNNIPVSAALLNHLRTPAAPTGPNASLSMAYINLHSQSFPGGEIRGQVPLLTPTWCPWGPTWWPCTRWTRWGTIWGLTICHPYCYAWNPLYVPRPFCIYGLRYYYTPLGNVRSPVIAAKPGLLTPGAVPLANNLNLAALSSQPWFIYNSVTIGGIPLRPPYYYWPYTPYCQRWYWFRCLPFSQYRYNPPVVHYAVLQNPTPFPVNNNFPDDPVPELQGTMAVNTTRAVVSQHSDLNGDGKVNAQDQLAYRNESGTEGPDSFFDVFTEVE